MHNTADESSPRERVIDDCPVVTINTGRGENLPRGCPGARDETARRGGCCKIQRGKATSITSARANEQNRESTSEQSIKIGFSTALFTSGVS